jgi:uncharacterized protein DUF4231
MVDEIENYLTERFEPQYQFYDKKARESRQKFLSFQIIIIVVSAVIPIVNVAGIGNDPQIRITSSILAGIVVILTSLLQLLKSHETWVIYRATANSLLGEKYVFKNNAGFYSNLTGDKKSAFVERVENIIAQEGTKYFSIHSQKSESEKTISTSGSK